MTKYIAVVVICLAFSSLAQSQDSSYRVYRSGEPGQGQAFSMLVPVSWQDIPEYDGTGFFAGFSNREYAKNKTSNSCFDSANYRLKYMAGDLAEAMAELGFTERGSGIYTITMNGYTSVVVGFQDAVNNYFGLECSFQTNAICPGGKVKKGAAEMQYLLFSNGKITICLVNNGIAMPAATRKAIIESFRFE